MKQCDFKSKNMVIKQRNVRGVMYKYWQKNLKIMRICVRIILSNALGAGRICRNLLIIHNTLRNSQKEAKNATLVRSLD